MADRRESEDLILPPSNLKSDVWKYFGFPVLISDGGVRTPNKSKTVCKECKSTMPYNGNTTNMRTHMKRHHPDITLNKTTSTENTQQLSTGESGSCPSIKIEDSSHNHQNTITSMFEKQKKFAKTSQNATTINGFIARFIVSDMCPLSLIDSREFSELLHCLEPRYILPCRCHFSDIIIPQMYENLKFIVADELKKAISISITTDSWTSRACQSYMTVTAHFTDENWKIRNYTLTTRMLTTSHTGENLGNALKEVMNEWSIHAPAGVAVVSDNAANMNIAAQAANLSPHVKCFAHTINLASQRGLKVSSMAKLLSRIRRIVTFFHKSTTATAVLRTKQLELNIPEHRLINDVPTRWNSSHDMISRFLEQQPAILSALISPEVKRNIKDIVTLSDSDINEAEQALEVSKPLKTATAIICDEQYPTVSMIFPLQTQILESMTERASDCKLIKEVKSAVRGDLNQRYKTDEEMDFLMMASALDPRFRSLPQVDDERKIHIYENLEIQASLFADVHVKTEPQTNDMQSGSNNKTPSLPSLPDLNMDSSVDLGTSGDTGDNDNCPSFPKKVCESAPERQSKGAMEDLFGDVYIVSSTLPTSRVKSNVDVIRDEIKHYKNEPNVHISENPMSWWSVYGAKYPELSKLAKAVLSIPGISVPSERVFSTAGDIVTATRSCLDPEMVDKLIFLKMNMRKQQK